MTGGQPGPPEKSGARVEGAASRLSLSPADHARTERVRTLGDVLMELKITKKRIFLIHLLRNFNFPLP